MRCGAVGTLSKMLEWSHCSVAELSSTGGRLLMSSRFTEQRNVVLRLQILVSSVYTMESCTAACWIFEFFVEVALHRRIKIWKDAEVEGSYL